MHNAPFPELAPTSSSSSGSSGGVGGHSHSHQHSSHAHSHNHNHNNHSHSVNIPISSSSSSSSSQHGHSHHGGHDHSQHAHSHDHHAHAHSSKTINNFLSNFDMERAIATHLPVILADPNARKVLFFIGAKVLIMFFQFLYGIFAIQITVVAASFHTVFDCCAMATSLVALVLLRKSADRNYTYGYDRFSVLSAFTNALFLLFVALFLIIESTHRLSKPPETHSVSLFMAMIGLCLDLAGIMAFWPFASTTQLQNLLAISNTSKGNSLSYTIYANMHAIFLHAAADLMLHAGLLLATWLEQTKDLVIANGVVFIIISIVIVHNVYPLASQMGLMLLQTTPPSIQIPLDRAIRLPSLFMMEF